MNPEMTRKLREPFPPERIKQLQGKDYIPGYTAIDRLIQATDNNWSFRITNVVSTPGHVAMQGELTIGSDTRSAWGEARSNNNPTEELFKNAETDTLKRCARLFGVALELYGDWIDDATGEVVHRASAQPRQHAPQARQTHDNRRYGHVAPAQPRPDSQPPTAPRQMNPANADEPATQPQIKAIFAIGRKLDIDVKPWVHEQFGGRDIDSLTRAEASLIIEDWQEQVNAQPVG